MEHEIPFTTFQPGIATSQPHKFLRNGATILGRKAAKRAAKSREVDFSPSRGFHLRFPSNMGSGMTGHLGFFKSHLQILHLISGIYWLIYWFHSNKNNWTGVCFSDIERANFSTSCLSCQQTKISKTNGKCTLQIVISVSKRITATKEPCLLRVMFSLSTESLFSVLSCRDATTQLDFRDFRRKQVHQFLSSCS